MDFDGFRFRHFSVAHGGCAMKVGTDGVLLGAWAVGGMRVLDVGTGSGLVALMMAQRFADAGVTAIDIEPGACAQASENVARSPFAGRVNVVMSALQDFKTEPFDSIVCNPPFYSGTPASRTAERTMARSAATLPFAALFSHAARLLTADGVLSVIVPASVRGVFDVEAALAGLYPLRACGVKTVSRKPVGRWLLAYGKCSHGAVETEEHVLSNDGRERSEWYAGLTKEFYL